MQKRFEILSDALQQNNNLMLLIDAGRNHFNVLAIDYVKKEALAACNFEMDEFSYDSISESVSQFDIFRPYYHKMAVAYNVPQSILTPEAYADKDNHASLDLLYGDLNRGNIVSEPVAAVAAKNIYRVEPKIQEAISLHFPVHHYYHIYSVLLKQDHELQSAADSIRLVFYAKQMIMIAVKGGQLQMLQTFPLDGAEDVAYYLLKVCNDLQFSPANTKVIVSGWVNTQSAVYLEIMKYFLQVGFEEDRHILSFDEAFAEQPLHFFSPLINLAACVL